VIEQRDFPVKKLPQNPYMEKKKFFTKRKVLIFFMITLLIVVGALFLGLLFA